MKKISLSLVYFSISFLYSMNDSVEITLANNQKALLPKTHLKRLVQCSTTLKNAAEHFNKELLTDFPFIEDPAALERMSNLLNDDGTPNKAQCLSKTKGDWCTMAPALAALDIEPLNHYLLDTLETTYSSPRLCKEILRNGSARFFSYETLPPHFKDELARRINQKNVINLTKYSAKTISGVSPSFVTTMTITSDSKTLISGSFNGVIKIWDIATGNPLKILQGYNDVVNGLVIAPNGKTLVSCFGDATIKLWDLHTGSLLNTLKGHTDGVVALAITSDGQTLVSGSMDNTIKIWNLNAGEVLKTLQAHEKCINAVAISPDDQTIVSGSGDKTIKVWDLKTGELRQILKGHDDYVNAVAISPHGQIIVSGSGDRTLKLWDLATGKYLRTLHGHNRAVYSVAISPDCQTIVSGSYDTTVKLWNLYTGSLLNTLEGHKNDVTAVAMTPDSQILISGSADGTLKFWKLNLSPHLKNYVLHVPLEQALVIQALRTRPNRQKPFLLAGKPYEHFKQLPLGAQDALGKALNIKY